MSDVTLGNLASHEPKHEGRVVHIELERATEHAEGFYGRCNGISCTTPLGTIRQGNLSLNEVYIL